MSNPWTSLAAYSFTSYFGTDLHGAQITWYNNPASDTASDADDLKMAITYNLQSRQYIWYASDNSNDATWFVGQHDYKDLTSGDPISTGVTDFAGLDNSDIIFHMQITNPVSSATVTYDGFYTAATHEITFDGSTNPTIGMSYHTGLLVDLTPAADGDMDVTLDTATDAGCDNTLWTQEVVAGYSPACTETWNVGEQGAACVQYRLLLTRTLDVVAASTDETSCDFSIDYSEHTIKI